MTLNKLVMQFLQWFDDYFPLSFLFIFIVVCGIVSLAYATMDPVGFKDYCLSTHCTLEGYYK